MLDKKFFIKKRQYYKAVFLDILAFPFAKLLKKDWSCSLIQPQKIVLIGHYHIGDLLFITPLIAAIRLNYPKADIHVTCPKKFSDILKNNPNINGFIYSDGSPSNRLYRFIEMFRIVRRIRKEDFDLGISYNNNIYALNHLTLFLSGVKRRIGYAHKGLSFFLTDVVPFEGPKIIIEEWLDFARYLGADVKFRGPEIFLTDSEIQESETIITDLRLKPGVPVIAISPHAMHPFFWNNKDWISLCRMFSEEYNAEIVFIGSAEAEGIVEAIRGKLTFRTYSLAGKTTLRQIAAIVRAFDLLVSLDTGTRHIAAAQGTPVVFLRHGSDDNEELGPYGHNHFMACNKVPCAPCGDIICRFGTYACVKGITFSAVYNIVKNATRSWKTNGSIIG